MAGCLDCLQITDVPSLSPANQCLIGAAVGGYQNAIIIHCGVLFQTVTANLDPVAAFLAGTVMPLTAAAIVIAVANGAPASTTELSFADAVKWGLAGTLGDGIRGSMNPQDTITHQGGSCEQPEIANNVWRIDLKWTKVGRAGNTPDYDIITAFLNNRKAYHFVAVECGEVKGAVVLKAGTYTLGAYSFTRPEDGIREFLQRGLMLDTIRLFEPKSYAFPTFNTVMANFS